MNPIHLVFLSTSLIVGLGFLLKHVKIISLAEGKVISRFLMHSTFPALMITAGMKVRAEVSLWSLVIFAIVYLSIMVGVSFLMFKNSKDPQKGLLMMGTSSFNAGLFGFPIIEGLFGSDALVYAVMFDMGNTLMVFGVGYTIGLRFAPNRISKPPLSKVLWKIFTLPPVVGLFIGFLINAADITLPSFIQKSVETMAMANKSLVLLMMGIYLSVQLSKAQLLNIVKVLSIRYISALVMVVFVIFMMGDNELRRNVLLVCCLMPAGVTLIPFSDEMDYDPKVAGSIVNLSLIISFVSMWLLMIFIENTL